MCCCSETQSISAGRRRAIVKRSEQNEACGLVPEAWLPASSCFSGRSTTMKRKRFVAGHVCSQHGPGTRKPRRSGQARGVPNVLVRVVANGVRKRHETIRSIPTSSSQRRWYQSGSGRHVGALGLVGRLY
jgi:hypothetical protein